MQKFGKSELSSRSAGMVLIPAVVAVVAMLLSRSGLSTVVCWDVAWTAAAICALAGTLVGRRQSQDKDRWTLWIAAAVCWLAGQLAWDAFGLIGMPQSPNLADIGWWSYAVLVIVIMVRVRDRSLRVVAAAETLPLIASALALTFAELWHDASISSLPLAARLSALVYPALYVAAFVLTLQSMVGGSPRTGRSRGSRLVLGGVAAQAVAFTLWSQQLLDQTYVTGRTLLDPLWVLGLLAIGAGAAMSIRQTPRATAAGEPSDRGALLPAAMFMLLLAALVQARFTHAAAGAEIALAAGLTFSGLALIVRARLLERRLWVLLSRERAALTTLADREGELGRLNEQLVEDSRRDVLTGMRNRRAMSDDLPMLEARHQERGDSFALALCDIDHFKPYNDRLGHLAGDQALRAIAAAVRGALRAGDTAYRFGGEELLLVLGKANARDALAAAERVREAVEEMMLPHPDGIDGRLTVSIGVAAGSGDVGRLLACADAALYEAKHLGRNRVEAATDATVPQAVRRSPPSTSEEPIPRHLRGMLTVSRAAASGRGELPVLDALAKAIRSELSFQVVVVNLLDRERMKLRVVAVLGDEEARQTLLDSVNPWSEWEALIESDHVRCGAIWLPAGSYDFSAATKLWTPAGAAGPNADSWQPEDMLLLPLRGASGEVLGVVSVDQPLTGCRPDDPELTLLMTVADHAGLALEQSQRDSASTAVREESQELRLAAMMLLAETVDLRDPDTARHSRTVGVYARETAAALGLPPDQLERVHAAGVLHDLGKLGITDAILFKPGPLDEPEWREIRRHPELGARILEHAGMTDIAGWVRAHHERLDGHGYPRGLLAGEIVLEARILAVADSYEAMVTDRPYHAGIEPARACAELLRCAGTQFDLRVVEAFLNTLPRHSQPPGNRLVAAA